MIELLLCTLIWGASFVAQKLGADHFGPFSINCYRNLLAGFFLLGCIAVRDRLRGRPPTRKNRQILIGGAASGVCLFLAMLTQQLGIERTSPGVSAFLTANYVLFVPVFAIVFGRRAGWSAWAGVLLSLFGSFLMCFPDFRTVLSDFRLGPGESWTLLCAALFAIQILVVDRFSGNGDMLRFSMVQMFVAGLVALPFVFLPSELSRTNLSAFVRGIPALLWLGLVSSGIAYTLQNLGQAKVSATLASIVMSLEGAFAVLFGWLILDDVLSVRQLVGCGIILLAVLVSQLIPGLTRQPWGRAAVAPRSFLFDIIRPACRQVSNGLSVTKKTRNVS